MATGVQSAPVALPDGTGGVFVVWEDTRSGAGDVWCQRLTRAGAPALGWPAAGLPVCTAALTQTGPQACGDGAGGLFVAWTDQTSGVAGSDVYLQRVSGAGTLAPGWPAASSRGVLVSNAARKQVNPIVVSDGTGGVFVAWTDTRTGAALNDVALTHVLADGTFAGGWPANGADLFFDGWQQVHPAIAPDGAGGVFLAFADNRMQQVEPALASDVFVIRFDGVHEVVPNFSPEGTDVIETIGTQQHPALVPDGAGGVLVAWEDLRDAADPGLYATRLDGDATRHAGWGGSGLGTPLCTAAGAQDQLAATSDGAGGCFAAWRDTRTLPPRVYATRLTDAGTIAAGWPSAGAGGRAVCDATADQQQHALAADGAGGAIVVWRDARNATLDVYAQRLGGDGATWPGWPADGVAVCTAAGTQFGPALAPDGAGGAFVFWTDQRADGGDLYGTHLTATGDPAPVAGVAPAAARFAFALAGASPARGAPAFALALPAAGAVTVEVFDAAGRRVRALLANEPLAAGVHTLRWDGRDAGGRAVAPGLYFAAARALGERRVARAALAR